MSTTLGPYAALSWRFTVRCTGTALTAQVARALRSLEAPGARTTVQYELTAPTTGTGSLALAGEPLLTSDSEWLLYAHLLWHVNVGAVDATTDHVLLHAAAAERGGRAVLLCAPMESGKTTLVAGLVLAGLDYLTDEAVAVRPDDGGITPFPKALSVDHGSWTTLTTLRPSLPDDALHFGHEQWQVDPCDVRADSVSAGAHPSLVLLPSYTGRGSSVLQPLSPGVAMLAVLGQTFQPARQRRRDMQVIAAMLETCTSYRLQVGRDLDEAVALVLEHL